MKNPCKTCKFDNETCFNLVGHCDSSFDKWQPKEEPMYEILKDVTCESVYKATLLTECFESFLNYFVRDLNYRFDGPISLSDLMNFWENHPYDLHWLIANGFIGIVKPAFVPFKLPIETEEEAKTIWYLLEAALRVSPDCLANVWLRLSALYKPKEVNHD